MGKKASKNALALTEDQLLKCEKALRAWFICDADPVEALIDGLDIGWGGVQRWATGRVPLSENGLHLDVACGYATFLAQLGWRFPSLQLIGLNIDFTGPHALASSLLEEAGVDASLVQADARRIPFAVGSFDSLSCFLGLQDIEIGSGEDGILATVADAIRVLRPGGILILIDEYSQERFEELLNELGVSVIEQSEHPLDIRWDEKVAAHAIHLYAEGWVDQMNLPEGDEESRAAAYREIFRRMEADCSVQLSRSGYYVPFGPVRMVVGRKWREQ
jgi:SAM-dependent methyltransferase